MGVNPEELYNQQKRVQQDHQRAAGRPAAHGTLETWQIEQESASRGEFQRDPMDQQKPGFIARLLKRLGIRK